uniref:Uncharacterized protein n=1 Tax=Arundo donax TaxID=35708 RepID=A0A0A9ATP6_ARUDO
MEAGVRNLGRARMI